jgi:hypothetical protein
VASRVVKASELAEAAGDDACSEFLREHDYVVMNDISEAIDACRDAGFQVYEDEAEALSEIDPPNVAEYLQGEHGYLCFETHDDLAEFVSRKICLD